MNKRPNHWRNRIIGEGEEDPTQLLASPFNHRIHPKAQQDALSAALREVGIVQRVIVSKRTGHVLDGHLRVALAISNDEPRIPVEYVDLDENEEHLVLASFDRIGSMAGIDKDVLDDLLREVETGEADLQKLLADLAKDAGLMPDLPDAGDADQIAPPEMWGVIVTLHDEQEQVALLERLQNEGFQCRAMLS